MENKQTNKILYQLMFKANIMLQFFYTLIIIAITAARPGKFYTTYKDIL